MQALIPPGKNKDAHACSVRSVIGEELAQAAGMELFMHPRTDVVGASAERLKIVAIGASAGGINILLKLLTALSPETNCCLLIVLHLGSNSKSVLPDILRRGGRWKVQQASSGDEIEAGVAYIAPPDFHLVLAGKKLQLKSTAAVDMHRPSVDVLFKSVADECGALGLGVLLSGSGRDGSVGLKLMKLAGGQTIVQDPADALFPWMPTHGIETGCADFVIPSDSIARKISSLCARA
jgi:two-component system chemotaxis response regulator CheB